VTVLPGEPQQDVPEEPQQEHKSVSQRLWLIGIVADVAAVLTVLAGSARNTAVVVGSVALLLGAVQLVTSRGKPVDRWVLLAVVGIVAGAVTITVVVDRSLVGTPAQASGTTFDTTTTTAATTTKPATSEAHPNTTTKSTSAAPGVSRTSGDKPILLTSGHSVDLDSQEPDWGVQSGATTGSGNDLKYSSGYLGATEEIALVTAQATLDDCVRAGYHDVIGTETDAAYCVKTNKGAFARIVIIAKDSAQLTLDVVVWQKQT